MADKSKFAESIEKLSPEQFKTVISTVEQENQRRNGAGKSVAHMNDHEFEAANRDMMK